MNRKKKINSILKARAKKTNAKNNTSNKPKYISKADRAALELSSESTVDALDTSSEQTE